jgi:hypothetical protein
MTGKTMKTKLSLILLAAFGMGFLPLQALALPKATGLAASETSFSWSAVDGAGLYRVAVWKPAASKGGKSTLMAAVWVKGTSWTYGDRTGVIAKAGKLASTKAPDPDLAPGVHYKLWVSAYSQDASDKSDWSYLEFTAPGGDADPRASNAAPARSLATATATPTPLVESSMSGAPVGTATVTPTPGAGADLELDVADEFKETPEAMKSTATASASTLISGTASLDDARALLQAGKTDLAIASYKKVLDSDATNADAWEGLGDAYDSEKMKIEAKEAYEKALAIDSKRDRLKKWLDDNVRH